MVHLYNVCTVLAISNQVAAEVVCHFPEEIFIHISESVTLSGEIQHIKSLVCSDKCIDYASCICRVNIVIHISVNKKKMSFKILDKFLVEMDAVVEYCIAFFCNYFFYTVMGFTPPAVVDTVVVLPAQETATL